MEKAMATHSSTLAWKIPWAEEPGRLQSMESLRVGHDWTTSLSLFTFMHWRRKWQPTPVLLPVESQGWGSLVGCRLWGRTESEMTEATYQQQQEQHTQMVQISKAPKPSSHLCAPGILQLHTGTLLLVSCISFQVFYVFTSKCFSNVFIWKNTCVCLGFHNKIPQTGWDKQQKSISTPFCRLGHSVGRVGSGENSLPALKMVICSVSSRGGNRVIEVL